MSLPLEVPDDGPSIRSSKEWSQNLSGRQSRNNSRFGTGKELFVYNFGSADPTVTLVWSTFWTVPLEIAIKCQEGDVLGEFGRNHTTLRHCAIPEA